MRYVYDFTFSRLRQQLSIEMVICCGDDGAVFPGDFEAESGGTHSANEEVVGWNAWSQWTKVAVVTMTAIAVSCCMMMVTSTVRRSWRQYNYMEVQVESDDSESGMEEAVELTAKTKMDVPSVVSPISQCT